MSSHPQVRLIPATVALLNALSDDPSHFAELIGSPVPDGWPEFPEAIGFTLAHLVTAIGYEVAPAFRGRRFGVTAARALVECAVASGEVDHVIAHTLPGPNPSTGVLVSLGFQHVDDLEEPDARVVWEWRWTRFPEGTPRAQLVGRATPP
jgi:RimJ/RimL family protein N-acetyltransferase